MADDGDDDDNGGRDEELLVFCTYLRLGVRIIVIATHFMYLN